MLYVSYLSLHHSEINYLYNKRWINNEFLFSQGMRTICSSGFRYICQTAVIFFDQQCIPQKFNPLPPKLSNLHYTVFINKDDKNLETFPAVMGDFQDKRFKFEKKHSLAVSLLTKQERELPWRSAYTKIVLSGQCERQPQSSGRRFKPRHIKSLNESCMHDVTVWSCQVLHRGILK